MVAFPTRHQGGVDDPPNSFVVATKGTVLDTAGDHEFSVPANVKAVELVGTITGISSPIGCRLAIQAYDFAAQAWETLIQTDDILATGPVLLQVSPFLTPITSQATNRAVRRKMRIDYSLTSGSLTGSLVVHAN